MAAAAPVALAGLGLSMPTAASATAITAQAMTSAHQSTTISPDTSSFYTFTEYNLEGTPSVGGCLAGSFWDGFQTPVKSARNNCEYPIWLQQNKFGKKGWSYCIDPDSTRNRIGKKYWDPKSIYVGRSKGKC
jgi:hypothetical protein